MAKHILSDSQIIDLMNFDISDDDLDCSDVKFDLSMYFILLLYDFILTF
jgi:hypothetical protein